MPNYGLQDSNSDNLNYNSNYKINKESNDSDIFIRTATATTTSRANVEKTEPKSSISQNVFHRIASHHNTGNFN